MRETGKGGRDGGKVGVIEGGMKEIECQSERKDREGLTELEMEREGRWSERDGGKEEEMEERREKR